MNQIAITNQRGRAGSSIRGRATGGGSRPALPIILLLLAIFIPSQAAFMVGGLVLTGYRVVILVFIIPAIHLILSQRRGLASWVDLLVITASCWFVIATTRNDGLSRGLEGGGALAAEFLGTYGLTRAFLTKESHVVWVAKFLAIAFFIMMPFMVVESITGKHVLKDMVAAVVGGSFYVAPDTRWGFERAWGVFDHPILAGVVSSTTISLIWFSIDSRKPSWIKFSWIFGSVLATLSTFSSGALGALVLQAGCISWYYATRSMKYRWRWVGAGLAILYLLVELLSNRTAYAVLISFLTFNPSTGFYRVEIIHWGFYYNILREPIFGIGESNWIRAPWMHSSSVDNFWLKIAMDRGIPMFLMITSAVMVVLLGNRRKPFGTSQVRLGWTISMIAICFAGCTVHYWNHSFVWFAFFLGIGTLWLRDSPPIEEASVARSCRPDRAVSSTNRRVASARDRVPIAGDRGGGPGGPSRDGMRNR